MQQSLSRFFVIKSVLYLVAFSVFGYLYYTKDFTHKNPQPTASISQSQQTSFLATGLVCADQRCFQVEIADNEASREYGLMNRPQLDLDKGLLFIFEQDGIYPFWMKNTLIPLDMIWIDQQKKVIDIQTAQPCTSDPCPVMTPNGTALYVLELNAGISKIIGLQTGDILTITL